MKKLLLGLLSLTMIFALGGCAQQKNEETAVKSDNEQYDIVIIGAGGAGLSAAVEAAENGAKNVLVLEKMGFAGGSTTMAFGGFNCTNSRFMDEQGKDPQTPIVLTDNIMRNGKGFNDVRMAAMVAAETPAVIEWLDGFGSEWGKIRYSNLHCPTDGTIPGVELVKVLREQTEKQGIEIRYDSPAVKITADETGRINGVVVKDSNGEYTIDASAVILATGGYENNPEMIDEYGNPSLKNLHLAPSKGNMGDGIKMALEHNADLVNMDLIQLSCAVAPFSIQMQMPIKNNGVVFVNKEGKRFTNEFSAASSDRRITDDILAQTDAECYCIYNETIYQEFQAVENKDFFDEYRMTGIDNSGLVIKCDTLEELADKMSIDQAALLDTISNLKTDNIGNEVVVEKADTYAEGPYYAVLLTPGVMDTLGGLVADTSARILDTEGKVIKGLYGAGEVLGNTQGAYYSVGLGEAAVFGRIAARNAIEYITDRGGLTDHVEVVRESNDQVEVSDATYTDGEYEGVGKGNNGDIKVSVKVENGKITEITVLEHSETDNIYAGAESKFIPALIKSQNLEIDAVAGATNSSNGIREAVKAALGK